MSHHDRSNSAFSDRSDSVGSYEHRGSNVSEEGRGANRAESYVSNRSESYVSNRSESNASARSGSVDSNRSGSVASKRSGSVYSNRSGSVASERSESAYSNASYESERSNSYVSERSDSYVSERSNSYVSNRSQSNATDVSGYGKRQSTASRLSMISEGGESHHSHRSHSNASDGRESQYSNRSGRSDTQITGRSNSLVSDGGESQYSNRSGRSDTQVTGRSNSLVSDGGESQYSNRSGRSDTQVTGRSNSQVSDGGESQYSNRSGRSDTQVTGRSNSLVSDGGESRYSNRSGRSDTQVTDDGEASYYSERSQSNATYRSQSNASHITGRSDSSASRLTRISEGGESQRSESNATDRSYSNATDRSYSNATDRSYSNATDRSYSNATDRSYSNASHVSGRSDSSVSRLSRISESGESQISGRSDSTVSELSRISEGGESQYSTRSNSTVSKLSRISESGESQISGRSGSTVSKLSRISETGESQYSGRSDSMESGLTRISESGESQHRSDSVSSEMSRISETGESLYGRSISNVSDMRRGSTRSEGSRCASMSSQVSTDHGDVEESRTIRSESGSTVGSRRSKARFSMLRKVAGLWPGRRSSDIENRDRAFSERTVIIERGENEVLLDDRRTRAQTDGNEPWDHSNLPLKENSGDGNEELPPMSMVPPPPPSNPPPPEHSREERGFVMVMDIDDHLAGNEEPLARDENQVAMLQEIEKAESKIDDRKYEFHTKVETLEEQRDQKALLAAEKLATSSKSGEELDDLDKDEAFTSLTPSQIALLYSTLQCSAVEHLGSKAKKQEKQKQPSKKPGFPVITLGSEHLVLSHAYHVDPRYEKPRETKVIDTLHRKHPEEVYPQIMASTSFKQDFWDQCATKIQAAWRGMRCRSSVRKMLREKRLPLDSIHCKTGAHLVSTYRTVVSRPSSNTTKTIPQTVNQSPQSRPRPRRQQQQSEIITTLRARPGSMVDSDFDSSDSEDDDCHPGDGLMRGALELEELPLSPQVDEDEDDNGHVVQTIDGKVATPKRIVGERLENTGDEILGKLFTIFLSGTKDGKKTGELSLSMVISLLRKSRAHVTKSEFDHLVDQVIKKLFRVPDLDPYRLLDCSAFKDLVANHPDNQFQEEMLVLAKEMDSMATNGLLHFYQFTKTSSSSRATKQVDGLTSVEVRQLNRLFTKIASSQEIIPVEAFIERLYKFSTVRNDELRSLKEFANKRMEITSSDLIRYVETRLDRDDAHSVSQSLLQVAWQLNQRKKDHNQNDDEDAFRFRLEEEQQKYYNGHIQRAPVSPKRSKQQSSSSTTHQHHLELPYSPYASLRKVSDSITKQYLHHP